MAETSEPAERAGRRLSRRFLLLLLAAVVPLVLLLLALGLRTYERTTAEVIARHSEAQQVRRTRLEELVGAVHTHVAVMRSYVGDRLRRSAELPAWEGPTEWIGTGSDPGPDVGVLLSPPGRLTEAARREITAVAPMYALSRATHAAHPFLRWSYFFAHSRSFMTIYPWAPAADLLAGPDPVAVFDGYYGYDVYALAEPERNPDRAAYWTPVYLDAGGAGLMVSHAVPIDQNGVFLGIVGADVLLTQLSQDLAKLPPTAGAVVVVDQKDNVVAAAAGLGEIGSTPLPATALLGDLPTASTEGRFRPWGDRLVSSVGIEGTPWRLVMTIPGRTIVRAVFAELWPHALLLAGILATFATFAFLFGRQFVRPAVALARFVAAAPNASERPPPAVPEAWRGFADQVRVAFEEREQRMHQMRAMVDGIPLRAVYVDAQGIYRDVNREFLDFLGLSREEVIGRHVRDVLGPAVEEAYRRLAPRILAGETARWEGEIEFLHQGRRHLQVSVLPFVAKGETEPGFLTFTRDLTDLKIAEGEAAKSVEALAASEALHRSIVLSALDGIIVIDEAGITREFNPAAEAIFGHRAEEVVGRPIGDVIIPPSMRDAHRNGMATYLETGIARVVGRRIEVTGLAADGSELPIELTVTEVRQGEHRLFTSHIRDLREQKRLAREIEASRNRLHHVEKLSAMGSLLASVAHELNNPLAIVIAQSTLLAEKAGDDGTRQRADRIRAAADRCGRIVKSFLAMARQKPPQREPLDMGEVVRSSLEMVGYGLRSSGITVETALAEDLPTVLADRDLLSQVVSNLLLNAQQALIERPLPRLIRVSGERRGDRLVIGISDNGPGVPPAIAERIFDPYFTTKAAGVGTGIGLSISRNIVASHGGELSLTDRPEGGAAFAISLPIAASTQTAGATAAETEEPQGHLRILVVDDEPDVAASLAEMIELLGHRAVIAEGADRALALIDAGERFDAVLSDLRMPGVDGVGLVERLAERDGELARRVVLVTGDTVAGPVRLARLGREDLVTIEKPFTLDDVRGALDRVTAEV